MKTLKKILTVLLGLCCFGGMLFSCTDNDNDPAPKIKCIIQADRTKQDSLLMGANSGDLIIIVGENLGRVDQIFFDNTPAIINLVYVTDNNIIVRVPELTGSTSKIVLVTKKGQQVVGDFAINIPAPRIDMFLCEFVPQGEILKIKGKYFIEPLAYFYGEDGQLIPAEIVPREPKSNDYVHVKVPAGVKHSTPVVIENGTGKTESKILFRDKRNIIMDFDEYKATWDYSGTINQNIPPDEDGRCTWKEDYLAWLPNGDNLLNPKGCDGIYAQLNTNIYNGWYDIMFYLSEAEYTNPKKSCVERFDEYDLNQLTLKFEVYVPKEYPINGMYAVIAFAPEGNGGDNCFGRDLSDNKVLENMRIPGAWWVQFTPEIDKTDPWWKWDEGRGKGAKEVFYTDEWITISVPLSTFDKQTAGTNPLSVLNYVEGGTGGDPLCKTPLIKNRLWNFAFFWEPWGQCDQLNGSYLCFLDNFRVVPDDKNGATFGIAGGITRKY